jgi:hypothetical protein
MRRIAGWRLYIALAGGLPLTAAILIGPDAAYAQDCTDQKRIEELQKRIATYEERLKAANKAIGDAEVKVYEAQIKRDAAHEAWKKIGYKANTHEDFVLLQSERDVEVAKEKVESAKRRVRLIEKDIDGFKQELQKLLNKPCPKPQALPDIPFPKLPDFSGWFFGIGMRAIDGTTDINESLAATGVKTFDSRAKRDMVAITGEIGYVQPINSTMFAGVAASITGTNLDMLHGFANGTSLGTRMDVYAALAAQGGVWVTPAVAVFGEVGGAIGRQTLEVNFAPVLSTSEWKPGVLFGGGVKVRAGQMPVLFTARYNRIVFESIDGRPPGSAFNYSNTTRLDTFRAGIEVPIPVGR